MNRILFFLLFLLIFFACTSDTLPEPSAFECPTTITYSAEVKAIVDKTCAYDGCHVAGFSSGDFTTYAGMQAAISSGAFERRAVEQRNMPPSNVPTGQPENLTEAELNTVGCWIQDGYVE